MKSILIFLPLLISVLLSCSFFEDKDKLLTDKEWMLYSRDTTLYKDTNNSRSHYYKKSEKELTFKFKTNGDLIVTQNNGSQFGSVNWNWINEKKDGFILDTGKSETEFMIVVLNQKNLTFFRHIQSENSLITGYIAESFRLNENKTWTDESIDKLNKKK